MSSDDATQRPWRGWLAAVVLAALLLRLGWGLSRPASDAEIAALPDQVEYLSLARNLLHGQGLWFVDPRFMMPVHAFRMPGYPLFVAACGANVRAVRIVQSFLDAATVLAVFVLARQIMARRGARAALLAAAIVAVNPMLIYISSLLLSETLLTAMEMWGIVLLLAGFGTADRRARAHIWLAGGVLLALGVLVRPSAIGLPVVLGLGAMFVNHRKGAAYQPTPGASVAGRWPLPVGTTMLVLTVLALVPWGLRNYRVLHRLIWTDTNSGFTLFDGYNPDATGASDQRFVSSMPQLQLMDEAGRSQYLAIRALHFVQHHPQRVGELALAKAARTWSPVPLSDQFGDWRHRLIAGAYAIPFDILVLCGIFLGNLGRPAKAFLLLPALYFTLIHALTVGSLRYRLPAEPALAVLAVSVFAGHHWKKSEVSL